MEDNQYGPKTIEIGNWIGKAIYSPISYVTKLINKQKELEKLGVYILKSTTDNPMYSEKVYIGEGNIRDRLKAHLRESKMEFDELIAFVSKDNMLNKAFVEYLEAESIRIVKEAKTAKLANIIHPNKRSLHEADISVMQYFLEQMEIILPLVGFMCFKPNTINKEESNELIESIKNNKEKVYYISREDIEAKSVETEKGFIVLKGSTCRKGNVPSLKRGRVDVKNKLIEADILKEKGDIYVFTEDTIFNSPSEAASLILGAQTSGPQTWKDKDGRTYLENTDIEMK